MGGLRWLMRACFTGREWRVETSDVVREAGDYDLVCYEVHVVGERVVGAPDSYPDLASSASSAGKGLVLSSHTEIRHTRSIAEPAVVAEPTPLWRSSVRSAKSWSRSLVCLGGARSSFVMAQDGHVAWGGVCAGCGCSSPWFAARFWWVR
ncbi:hypothetical protein DL991_32550 [Amycolatopsis sp. WAC 01375]|nr:hypothetical protein DL991_32550 [Amycolatopsis sp. WAC 01375]